MLNALAAGSESRYGRGVDEREALAREIYEVWSRDGPATAAKRCLTEDVVWHDPPETPDAAVLRGRDRVVALWEEREPILGTFDVEFEDATEIGPELLTAVMIRSRSERGFEIKMRHFHLLRFRDGRLSAIRVFSTRADAEAAAESPQS
jgi:ketosteroid isomerase-like protein